MKISPTVVLSGLLSVSVLQADESNAPAAPPALKIDADHPPLELKLDYQVGKTYISKTDMTSVSTVPLNGEKMEQKVKNQMTIDMKVNAVEGSTNKEVVTTYKRYAMRTETMGMVIEADSDSPDEANPALAPMMGIVGKSITMVVDANNQTTEVRGVTELFESMDIADGAKVMIEQMFSEEALEKMYGFDMKSLLPNKPVSAGDSWTFAQTIPMTPLGNLDFDGTYTLQGTTTVDGQTYAVIKMDASMELAPANAGDSSDDADEDAEDPAAAMLSQLKMTDTSFKATLLWDTENHFMKSFDMEQTMTMTMPNPAEESGVMSIPSKTRQTVTVEIK